MLLMLTNMRPALHGQMVCIIYVKLVAHVYNHVLIGCPGPGSHESQAYTKYQTFFSAVSMLLSVAKRALGPMQPVPLHDSFVTYLTLSQNKAEVPGNLRGHPPFVLEWELTGHRPAALGIELRDTAPLASEK